MQVGKKTPFKPVDENEFAEGGGEDGGDFAGGG